MKKGFNPHKYLENQGEKFKEALTSGHDKPAFLEFGGKPFSDHHAERVMPGYDPECKAEILKEFEAATADLGNKVLDVRNGGQKEFRTSYDKDVENFALLGTVAERCF